MICGAVLFFFTFCNFSIVTIEFRERAEKSGVFHKKYTELFRLTVKML